MRIGADTTRSWASRADICVAGHNSDRLRNGGRRTIFSAYTNGAGFFAKEDKTLTVIVPAQLRMALLEHVLKGGDQDNITRARKAFEHD